MGRYKPGLFIDCIDAPYHFQLFRGIMEVVKRSRANLYIKIYEPFFTTRRGQGSACILSLI
ncbi:MAG: hypothetical protein JW969_17375 [Spirochaetales bacterium]|nr:hypothetical protein [Spirochaetales bacterium]